MFIDSPLAHESLFNSPDPSSKKSCSRRCTGSGRIFATEIELFSGSKFFWDYFSDISISINAELNDLPWMSRANVRVTPPPSA